MTKQRTPEAPEAGVSQRHWQMSRRNFCRTAAATIAVLSQGFLLDCSSKTTGNEQPVGDAGNPDGAVKTPACQSPQGDNPPALPKCEPAKTAQEKAIEAFCEVCIPGTKTDPIKDPHKKLGAVDVCAVALFFDPELPAAALVGLIVGTLNSKSKELYLDDFVNLTYEQQIAVVDELDQKVSIFGFAIQLAKLAYYSSESAAYVLGYPGANSGYDKNPNFSFGKAMSKEMTKDGNLP